MCLLTNSLEWLQALLSKHSQDARERLEKSRSASDDVCSLTCCVHKRVTGCAFSALRLAYACGNCVDTTRVRGNVLSMDEYVRVRVQMSHYARELQRERAAREKVAADLKALVGFEAGLSLFVLFRHWMSRVGWLVLCRAERVRVSRAHGYACGTPVVSMWTDALTLTQRPEKARKRSCSTRRPKARPRDPHSGSSCACSKAS